MSKNTNKSVIQEIDHTSDHTIGHPLADAIYKKFKEDQQKKYGDKNRWLLIEPDDKPIVPSEIWSRERVKCEYENTLRNPRKFQWQNEWASLSMEILNQMAAHKLSPGDLDLHIAVRQGFPSIIHRILQFDNININSKGFNGRTPLHECLCQSNMNMKVFCSLIAAGADFNVPDNNGETGLNLAILFWNREGQVWLPLMILDHIVDYDYERVNRGGENLLDYAKVLNVQSSVISKIEEAMKIRQV